MGKRCEAMRINSDQEYVVYFGLFSKSPLKKINLSESALPAVIHASSDMCKLIWTLKREGLGVLQVFFFLHWNNIILHY